MAKPLYIYLRKSQEEKTYNEITIIVHVW